MAPGCWWPLRDRARGLGAAGASPWEAQELALPPGPGAVVAAWIQPSPAACAMRLVPSPHGVQALVLCWSAARAGIGAGAPICAAARALAAVMGRALSCAVVTESFGSLWALPVPCPCGAGAGRGYRWSKTRRHGATHVAPPGGTGAPCPPAPGVPRQPLLRHRCPLCPSHLWQPAPRCRVRMSCGSGMSLPSDARWRQPRSRSCSSPLQMCCWWKICAFGACCRPHSSAPGPGPSPAGGAGPGERPALGAGSGAAPSRQRAARAAAPRPPLPEPSRWGRCRWALPAVCHEQGTG